MSATLVTLSVSAMAAALSPEQAAELLARSAAANEKCKVLSASETAELGNLANSAAQLLAKKSGQAQADAAVANGSDLGRNVSCDATTSQAITGILKAARAAAATAPPLRGSVDETAKADAKPPEKKTMTVAAAPKVAEPAPKAPEAKPVMVAKPEAQVSPASVKPAAKPEVKHQPARMAASRPVPKRPKAPAHHVASRQPQFSTQLAAYGVLAQDYYLKRRCRSLPHGQMMGFYARVVATHRATLRNHGVAATARVMRLAEARASRRSC